MGVNASSTAQCVTCGLVSVVVPIYNVDMYLADCLDSLLSQTYPDLEIILVDDGSTDGSASLCKRYADHDERVRYYRKENGGLSSARNFGIHEATGDYALYVDSDDLIAPDMIEHLMRALIDNHADVAVCGFQAFKDDFDVSHRDVSTVAFERMSAFDALDYLYCERSSGCAAWAKLARTESWRRVVFPEGRRFEDFPRIHNLFKSDSTVMFTDEPLYFYRKRSGSITSSMSDDTACELLLSINELIQCEDNRSGQLDCARAFKVALECSRLISKTDKKCPSARRDARRVIGKKLRFALCAGKANYLQKLRIIVIYLFPNLGSKLLKPFMK